MREEKPVREQDKFMLRLPDGMRDRLAQEAKTNRRSMNTEVVVRLERSLSGEKAITDIAEQLDRIEAMLTDHDRKLNPQNCG